MLYDRWRAVAAQNSSETALCDLGAGRSWTFQQLAKAGELVPSAGGDWVFPRGMSSEFILAVLSGWRDGKVVCPLEPDQRAPVVVPKLPRDVVHLKTTSASAGPAKLVAFQAGQLAADARNIVSTMGLRPEWPNLAAISLAHSYGFSNLVLPLLLHGVPLWIAEGPLPEAVRRAAARLRALSLPAVPALWNAWHQAGATPESVRLAISAGAPLPLALEQAVFARSHLKIHNFYGSSECGGIAYDRTLVPRDDSAVAGEPLEGVKVQIGRTGCVEVRGDAVASGYVPTAEAALRRGVFRTSDVGEIDGGQIRLLGRATDQINVAGRKVAPELIERTLTTHPDVKDCLVFGVPVGDGHRGDKIVAYLAVARSVKLEALKRFVLERLPAWQVPREWCLVDELRANGRGKISRAQWRQSHARELPRNGVH